MVTSSSSGLKGPQSDLQESENQRFAAIFNNLDTDHNGRISVAELSRVLHGNVPDEESRARYVISRAERSANLHSDNDGMTFPEFVQFATDQEKHLKLAFTNLDKNHDEQVDAREIQQGMSELGVVVSLTEAEALLKKMDKDASLTIDYDEWRDFLLFSDTSEDLASIVRYWRRASAIDLGELNVVPDEFTEEEKLSGVAWRTLLSGGVAGAFSRSATAPLDRLKVIWQAKGGEASKRGMLSSLRRMLKEGGVLALWRGNGVNCAKIAPEMAIKFTAFEQYKMLIKSGEETTLAEKFIAGGLAGATAQSVIYPLEVLKTRMCLRSTGQYSSLFDCARNVYREGGVRFFYRGYLPNLLGILPYAGIDLALYETFKLTYLRLYSPNATLDSRSQPPLPVSLCSGALSSVCGQVGTYPLALVRTRLQANIKGVDGDISMVGMFRHIVRTEGPKGLYRGIGPNMVKVIPAVSISYGVFEEMRSFLGLKR